MRDLNLALAVLAATLSMVAILRAGIEEISEKLGGSGSLAVDHRVRDYVEAHLDEDLSLTILADIACLSPYHFSRSFKESVGVGPQRYVMQRRLERAKTLMRRTNEPLALIAQEAGFADQSHLNSTFRREIGVTPGQFRAAMA